MFNITIQKIWYKKSLLRFLLWPFSLIFAVILWLRRILYRTGIKKTTHFNCPIIVIGNITVGGTGKTPLVIALATFLQSQGYSPAIISRGYKGSGKLPQFVAADSDPKIVGDEAVLLARHTHCPVVVSPNRVGGVHFLRKKTHCDVVLSDDGLQHLALGRTVEIAVIDGSRGLGNGLLLPAGPLRESKDRLNTVDFCIVNGSIDDELKFTRLVQNQFTMQLKPNVAVNLKNHAQIDIRTGFIGKKLHAVAGIGAPERFFHMLQNLGLAFTPHAFSDHYAFNADDFSFLKEDDWVIMTEKDAVKCEAFADERYWYAPVTAELPEDFFAGLLSHFQRIIDANVMWRRSNETKT